MKHWINQKKYGFIFDMDGVIIDTCTLHEKSWMLLSRICGFPWDKDISFKKEVCGTCSADSARILFKHHIADRDIPGICTIKEKIYFSLLKKHVHSIVVPGFHNFFTNAAASGIPVVLATSSTEKETDFVLKSLGIYHQFKAVLNISKVNHPKPHPEIYLKSCEALEIHPENCIGFEDSISGITSLGNAGVPCMVVGTTLSYERLVLSGLKFRSYIRNFEEISINVTQKIYYIPPSQN